MARYTGPKLRLMRREGLDLGLKSRSKTSVTKRLTVKPGQHGQKTSRKKVSSYGIQLREKQKVKRMYGMLERQFSRFFEMALKQKGNTGENLVNLLERRLDNVVYRLGFAPTRASARQLVSHGHIYVNDGRVSIPSFIVPENAAISLSEKAYNTVHVQNSVTLVKEGELPQWLSRQGKKGLVVGMPTRDNVGAAIHEASIIEYYSR